jgi:hypothetical protein
MAWKEAKVKSDTAKVMAFYAADFSSYRKNLTQWSSVVTNELNQLKGRDIALTNINMMRWTDQNETMVVTFDEVIVGKQTGVTKRQYWIRDGRNWKIFFEGII